MACSSGATTPSSCAMGGRIADAIAEMIGMSGTRMSLHTTFRIVVNGGSSAPTSMDRIDASGGSSVAARFPITGISGCITWKISASASQNTGSSWLPSCTRIGIACDRPSASRSTSCMSIGSMVGQLSMIVLKKVVSTGVNFAPASARKSAHIPLTPLTLLV